jgi:pantetheine-phosphate adenylyltransferase
VSVAVICPGSFDPITLGHLDVFERAARRFDRVVIAVLGNPRKEGLFTVEERMELIATETAHLDNIEVDRFQGLLVDFCADRGIGIVCKGLRGVGDFEYEQQMAQMNHHIGDVETLFVSSSPEHGHLSSSLVKEVARAGGRIEGTVPPAVEAALRARFA